ncbi:MAG: hypothetical protein EBV03_11075 [Proteobacteria bacterium]|nr:hypothetical protein [Pseudomonadota bacterium]
MSMPKTLPYLFGEKLAQENSYSLSASKPAAPSTDVSKPTTLGTIGKHVGDMFGNSARVGGGMLSTLAGGAGTAATALPTAATNAWNAVAPKSMQTSPAWSGAVNNAFNKSVELTNAGARDVRGGLVLGELGGDTNYRNQQSWDVMQRGFNDKTVDPISRGVATGAGWGGHAAWNVAQAVPAATGAMPAVRGAMQFGKDIANAGRNVVNTAANTAMAPVNFVRNTFRPGFGELRSALRNTSRVYARPDSLLTDVSRTRTPGPWRNAPRTADAPYGVVPPAAVRNSARSMSGDARLADTARNGAGGTYFADRNVATSLSPRNTVAGRETMRHELGHAFQANTAQPNSLQGWIQEMRNPQNSPWRQAAGHMLAEVNSNAAQAKSIPGQISNGLKFLTDPAMARYYSNYYANTPFASQYAMLHGGAAAAPYVGAGTAAAAGGTYGVNSILDALGLETPPPDAF